jgi:hypothetical protein
MEWVHDPPPILEVLDTFVMRSLATHIGALKQLTHWSACGEVALNAHSAYSPLSPLRFPTTDDTIYDNPYPHRHPLSKLRAKLGRRMECTPWGGQVGDLRIG